MTTAQGIGELSKCPLFYLDVSDCPALTDLGVRQLTEGGIGPRKHLQHLDMSRCMNVTDSGFFHIGMR